MAQHKSNGTDLFGQNIHVESPVKGEEYAGTITAETHAAIQFCDGENRVWLPKSRIHIVEDTGYGKKGLDRSVTVTIPDWLAKEKELI